MRLGKYFTVEEMCRSMTAARMGRNVEPPLPPAVMMSLQTLVANVLDPLREALDRPLTVLSGYRPPWLNKAVGGATNSQHVLGEAADIVVHGMSVKQLGEFIIKSQLPFDQLIFEFGEWIHISHKVLGQQRAQVLTARKVSGKTQYVSGLPR